MSGKWIPTDHHTAAAAARAKRVSRETEGWQRKPCSTGRPGSRSTSRNLYIAEFANNRIRMVAAGTGIISTLQAPAPRLFGDADRPSIHLHLSTGVAVDSSGNVYSPTRITAPSARSTPADHQHVRGSVWMAGDNGPATKAQIRGAQGVAVDASGNLYIADTGNERIRYVSASASSPPSPEPVRWASAAMARWLRRRAGRSGRCSPGRSACLRGRHGEQPHSPLRGGGNMPPRGTDSAAMWTIHAGATGQSMSVAVDSSGNLYIATPAPTGFAR